MFRFLSPLIALLLLLMLGGVFLFIGIILFITQKRNIFFCQLRPGKDGKLFYVIKFCTMTENEDLPEVRRITFLGKWLRKTHLDELPQLINIIKGEMAFIGPRPLLREYLPLYNQRQNLRHGVLPGITGWSQIKYGLAGTWQERLEADVWYVENQSFLLDCYIICKTLLLPFSAQKALTEAQMFERFEGNFVKDEGKKWR